MKRIFPISISAFVFLLASCGGNNSSENNKKEISGKEVYESNCTSCHGGDGKLGLMGAKDLAVTAMDENACIEIIKNGKGAMAPFKALLSDEEISAVAKYVMTLKK